MLASPAPSALAAAVASTLPPAAVSALAPMLLDWVLSLPAEVRKRIAIGLLAADEALAADMHRLYAEALARDAVKPPNPRGLAMPDTGTTGQRIAQAARRNPAALPATFGGGAVTLITLLALLRTGTDNGQALVRVLRDLGLVGAAVAVGAFLLAAVIVGWLQRRDEQRNEMRAEQGSEMRHLLAQLVKGQEQHGRLLEGQGRQLSDVVVEVRSLRSRVDEISRPVPRLGTGARTSVPRMTGAPPEEGWGDLPTQTEGGKPR